MPFRGGNIAAPLKLDAIKTLPESADSFRGGNIAAPLKPHVEWVPRESIQPTFRGGNIAAPLKHQLRAGGNLEKVGLSAVETSRPH